MLKATTRAAAALPPDQSIPIWTGLDLTGSEVAAVTEDWNYRMMTPAKGDYTGVPLNAEGRKAGRCLGSGQR
jgi:hypothetical protein